MSAGNISKGQGAVKASEISVDDPLTLLGAITGDTGMKVLDLLHGAIGDSLQKQNYILFSTGRIIWDGDQIKFVDGTTAIDATFRILQTSDPAIGSVDLVLTGTTGANGSDVFNNIPMDDQDLVYIEISRDQLTSGTIQLDFDVSAGGTSTGSTKCVKKVNLATGRVPQMVYSDSGIPTTFYIPLAMKSVWTNGPQTFKDVWWIPHGIRWTNNPTTQSTLGAIIVTGTDALPDYFVVTKDDLKQKILLLGGAGGIICLASSITVDENITIPDGVWIIGKGTGRVQVTVTAGNALVVGGGGRLSGVSVVNDALNTSGYLVRTIGIGARIDHCKIILNNVSGSLIGVQMDGTYGKVSDCRIPYYADPIQTGIVFNDPSNRAVDIIWA